MLFDEDGAKDAACGFLIFVAAILDNLSFFDDIGEGEIEELAHHLEELAEFDEEVGDFVGRVVLVLVEVSLRVKEQPDHLFVVIQ